MLRFRHSTAAEPSPFSVIQARIGAPHDRAESKADLLLTLLTGNFYGVTPLRGRYDASYGLLLRGRGDGSFEAVERERSGLALVGEVRAIRTIGYADGSRLIAVGRNNDSVRVLQAGSSGSLPRRGDVRERQGAKGPP